jgi:hypothetical protein
MAATGRAQSGPLPVGIVGSEEWRVNDMARSEVDLLFALVRERYGSRLTPEELEHVRAGVAAIVEGTRALRAIRLDNADGPALASPRDLPSAP